MAENRDKINEEIDLLAKGVSREKIAKMQNKTKGSVFGFIVLVLIVLVALYAADIYLL